MQENAINLISRIVEIFGMKSRYFLKLLISINFYLFLPISIHSQPDSLFHYLEIAARNNPAVLQKYYEYQAALQKIPQVGSLPDPQMSIGIFLKPMELVNGNQVADLRLMQMFPWFGVLKYGKDEMSLMSRAKYELFRDARMQVYYDVQRTWYDLYKVKKEISISEKNIEILKIIERLALASFKTVSSKQTSSVGPSSGNSGLADLYRIQIEAGDLENNIALLKNQERTVRALFNSYLNRPSIAMVFIEEASSADSLGFSLTAVKDSMLSKNPMVSMLEFEKQSIEARKNMVTRMGYPMFGLGLNYSPVSRNEMSTSSMNGKDMIMPMVTVTIPVYRKKYKAMKTEADLLSAATSQNYQAISNSLQNEYYQAVQLYQDAERRAKLYKNQYQLSSKSFDLLLKSFSASSSGLTDVLRVRQQTLDYEFKQTEAVADFNTAIAWLRRLGNFGNKWK